LNSHQLFNIKKALQLASALHVRLVSGGPGLDERVQHYPSPVHREYGPV